MNRYTAFGIVAIVSIVVFPGYMRCLMEGPTTSKSPQTVRMKVGSLASVGSNRAVLVYMGGETGGMIELRCKGKEDYFLLEPEQSVEACGVQVEFQGVEESTDSVPMGVFRVTWGE